LAYRNNPLLVDEQNRAGETRFLCLGETDGGKLLSFVFTERGENVRIVTGVPDERKTTRLLRMKMLLHEALETENAAAGK
jgi:uncharacterized DUF497 family protein